MKKILVLLVIIGIMVPNTAFGSDTVESSIEVETKGIGTDNSTIEADPSEEIVIEQSGQREEVQEASTLIDDKGDTVNPEIQDATNENETNFEDKTDIIKSKENEDKNNLTEDNNKIEDSQLIKQNSIQESTMATLATESKTSLLGHLKNSQVKIYPTIGDEKTAITAGSTYTNAVYYIKKQIKVGNQTYYLISTEPSSERGVVGWVKPSDLSTASHTVVDKENKSLFISGTGSAYSKAWGGNKDLVYSSLSKYEGREFKVHLTEKVGSDEWYRGELDGKTVWIHSKYLTKGTESKTSLLGHLKSSQVKIYPTIGDEKTAITAGSTYTNAVYYIKKQIKVGNQTYYLISTEPSSERGVVGWVKPSDLSTASHTVVDKENKSLFISGTGSAYSKAWGGNKDLVYSSLSKYEGREFKVHLTEKVGSDEWYRGELDGKTVWIHPKYLTKGTESKTSLLGHLKSSQVKIYPTIGDEKTAITAGSTYTNAVYYIKKQIKVGNQTYYLISTEPSSERGVVGWVKPSDLSTASHTVVDKENKSLFISGTGSAYSKAWGGNKDLVYSSLSKYEGREFKVHLTEKVGSDEWYRGELDGKTVWIHPKYLTKGTESKTSLLGHLKSSQVKIYPTIGDEKTAITAGSTYTNAVYYIKKQIKVGNQTYYLISTEPSSERGVVGWVKPSDLSTASHTVVDKENKSLFISGTGSAYSKAWGGNKDLVYSSLSKYEGREFKVHLTEKVGSDEWYRGELDGKTVWIHPKYLTKGTESKTSLLGHLKSSQVKIYPTIGDEKTAITAGSTYTNAVYYIKKQIKVGNQTYYLISTEPSSERGVVGWVKPSDLSTASHTVVDKENKEMLIKGSGSAYSKAWGGNKNIVIENLSVYKDEIFNIELTERVGEKNWYRGKLNNQTVWIEESYLLKGKDIMYIYTDYSLSLTKMREIQMAAGPLTDNRYKLWIREDAFRKGSISNGKGTIEGDNWNLRRGPGTEYLSGGKVNQGDVLTLRDQAKDRSGHVWYYVTDTSGWVTPDAVDLGYYLNPSNFTNDLRASLQFLKLSESARVNVSEVNEKILKNKGVLHNQAKAFVEAGVRNGINEIYLISHAILETGNGLSQLATGVQVGRDKSGNLKLVNSNNSDLRDIRTVYNMYGIGAKDACPLECGSQYAYEAGWFSIEEAIIGGAAFIGNNYINKGQDTLYKMRWNPTFAATNGYASHQYASDIGWAFKQTNNIYQIYSMLDSYVLLLEIPRYK